MNLYSVLFELNGIIFERFVFAKTIREVQGMFDNIILIKLQAYKVPVPDEI